MLASALPITPARVWRRAVALLLDASLAGLAAMVILFTYILPQQHPDYEKVVNDQMLAMEQQLQAAMKSSQFTNPALSDEFTDIAATVGVTTFSVLLVYFAASEMLLKGATLGKRVFGLRAARWGTAEPPQAIESLSRCIFKSASLVGLLPILLLANALPMLFRSTRRAGHDYLARTIVTGDPPPPAPASRNRYDSDDD
jgi:uncharacterized RDD family membrane protein YckC